MKRFALVFLVLAIGALAYGYYQITKAPPPLEPGAVIRIGQGEIQGGIDRNNPNVQVFNGLPYASQTRWRPPGDPPQWGGETRDARDFGPECMQVRASSGEFLNDLMKGAGLPWVKRQMVRLYLSAQGAAEESEDCLTLNVRTANLGGKDLQPVMVWIHGGSHQFGSGSTAIYQANGLVENGVVLVTINYRLGVFGYLAHPALTAEAGTSGNYGLMDQIAALKWVRANIAAFGGDPDNVTIFGESAGAQSVSEIMASPSSEGLFHKAILESGSSTYNVLHLNQSAIEGILSSEEAGRQLLDSLAGSNPGAETLRALPAADLLATVGANPQFERYLYPTVDGRILPQTIGEAIRSGDIAHVPMIAGYNADEATLFYKDVLSPTILDYPIEEDIDVRMAALAKIYGENEAEALGTLYGLKEADTHIAGAVNMLGDDMFGVHMRYIARANARAGQPSYTYLFTWHFPNDRQTIGAYHSAEIPFVFDSHLPITELSDADRELTEQMNAYWTNFARTGNPNGDGLPRWPRHEAATDKWMELGPGRVAAREGMRARKLDILTEAVNRRIELAAPLTPREEHMAETGDGADIIAEQD